MFTVIVRGLEFHAHHGVPDEERVIGHRYKLDLEMEVDGHADETDDISGTVDYGQVALQAQNVAHAHRYRTVERLAKAIANQLLKEHPNLQKLTITLVKRLPPAPMIADEAGVRIVVSRG